MPPSRNKDTHSGDQDRRAGKGSTKLAGAHPAAGKSAVRSVDEIRAQVSQEIQRLHALVDHQYDHEVSAAINAMTKKVQGASKERYKVVEQGTNHANEHMLQARDSHREVQEALKHARSEVEHSNEDVRSVKEALNKVIKKAEAGVEPIRKKFKLGP